MCFCVLSGNSQDLTSSHASASACDLKSKVLWCGLGLFGSLSETLTRKAREKGNMTNPIKTRQIALGLKIRDFEMCDFSLQVVTPTSKDIGVKYIIFCYFYYFYLFVCRYTYAERKPKFLKNEQRQMLQKEPTITNVSFLLNSQRNCCCSGGRWRLLKQFG